MKRMENTIGIKTAIVRGWRTSSEKSRRGSSFLVFLLEIKDDLGYYCRTQLKEECFYVSKVPEMWLGSLGAPQFGGECRSDCDGGRCV